MPQWSPQLTDGNIGIMGFDSEFTPTPPRKVVSYQTHFLYIDQECSLIFHPQGKRLTLGEIVGRTLEEAMSKRFFRFYPRVIVLAIHWSLADLTMLADFDELKTKFDSLRKTYATVKRPLEITWTDSMRHKHKLEIFIRDTLLLAPQSARKVANLGKLHGMPKIELPEGAIERMDTFLIENPTLFEAYAIRDAQIAALHAQYMAQLSEWWTGKNEVPISLGSLAVDYCFNIWEEIGLDYDAALGRRVVSTRYWSGKYITKKERLPVPGLAENEALAIECYHGGRNEAFYFGPTDTEIFSDWDLSMAYSTVLASIGTPDYNRIFHTTSPADFKQLTLGFARLTFRFPPEVRFPCLPVRTDLGLIFPQEGECYATAPEIWLACELGAEIQIQNGIVIPTNSERPFGAVIMALTKVRAANEKGSLMETMCKELVNSLYGKTGQGLRPKSVFDSRTGQSKRMPPSRITNPFFAAYTTGMVRAVLAEIINRLPRNRSTISATTDGLLTAASDEEVKIANLGNLAQMFAYHRLQLGGKSAILELKHRATQVLSWSTRGQATIQQAPGGRPVLAKGGLQAPADMNEQEESIWIVKLFMERTADTTCPVQSFTPLREIHEQGRDFFKSTTEKRAKMDFDWKRQPTEVGTGEIHGTPHLQFNTGPWRMVEQFLRCRSEWAQFQKQTRRCLKTEQDLIDFKEFIAAKGLNSKGINRSAKHGLLKIAQRQIHRAFVRSQWGILRNGTSYGNFAETLTKNGYPTKVSDLKNAAREKAQLAENQVPRTEEVEQLVIIIKTIFPKFEENRLFIL